MLYQTGNDEFDKLFENAGYSYEIEQDIFYSNLDSWQRKFGYCRLYDEAAAFFGIIIDCEPVYFEYDNKKWLIEFWKGQYAMASGCEIGVYTADGPDLDIPDVFTGTFYNAADDSDLLNMSYNLNKNGELLFKREDRHWWLTGFKLGEFSEPSELSMDISITLKDETMLTAFVEGLMKTGYRDNEIMQDGNCVIIKFDVPKSSQPNTRTHATDWIIQRKNEHLCKKYQQITQPYLTIQDKIKAIQEKAPEIYDIIVSLGKTKQFFEAYENIKHGLG